jgi:SIR2-like protein
MPLKLVLFLGAGFSRPYGLPTMTEFLAASQDSTRVSGEEKQLVDELFLEARHANSFLQSDPTNLEDVLSFSVMGDRLKIAEPTGVPRAARLKRLIQRIYTTPGEPQKYWDQFRNLEHFLGVSRGTQLPYELAVVTTNYDVCSEAALARLGVGTRLEVAATRSGHGQPMVTGSLYAPTGVPVLKLHGSVNWFENAEAQGGIVVDERVVKAGILSEHPGEIPYVCASDYVMPGTPVLVPPTFIKPDLVKPLEVIWQRAAEELQQAHYLAFVGYSFPATDTEMRYFLGRSLADNPRLRKIFVVDRRAGEIVKKLKAPGSGYGEHFRGFLEPLEGTWTGFQLPVLQGAEC